MGLGGLGGREGPAGRGGGWGVVPAGIRVYRYSGNAAIGGPANRSSGPVSDNGPASAFIPRTRRRRFLERQPGLRRRAGTRETQRRATAGSTGNLASDRRQVR